MKYYQQQPSQVTQRRLLISAWKNRSPCDPARHAAVRLAGGGHFGGSGLRKLWEYSGEVFITFWHSLCQFVIENYSTALTGFMWMLLPTCVTVALWACCRQWGVTYLCYCCRHWGVTCVTVAGSEVLPTCVTVALWACCRQWGVTYLCDCCRQWGVIYLWLLHCGHVAGSHAGDGGRRQSGVTPAGTQRVSGLIDLIQFTPWHWLFDWSDTVHPLTLTVLRTNWQNTLMYTHSCTHTQNSMEQVVNTLQHPTVQTTLHRNGLLSTD